MRHKQKIAGGKDEKAGNELFEKKSSSSFSEALAKKKINEGIWLANTNKQFCREKTKIIYIYFAMF